MQCLAGTKKKSILIWIFISLLITGLLIGIGENPVFVTKVLLQSAFGSLENISYTLFYATPLILTGASVLFALKAGLFNIGAEGQLYIGSLFAIAWGIFTRDWIFNSFLLQFFAIVGGFISAFIGGAAWGALAGYLRAYRNTHEVMATILLNFIAIALTNWAILNVFKNPNTQNSETLSIAPALQIQKLWLHMPVSTPLALVITYCVLIVIYKTWYGFSVRCVGENDKAAALAQIPVKHRLIQSMLISGGISGLVGFHEIYCHSYRLLDGFSSGLGYTGLAIALISDGKFSKLIFASIFFSALYKGTLDLEIETEHVTRELSLIIQALILIVLAVVLAYKREKNE